jgi:glycosyltransferase involved in cell wall biosynthesis
LPIAATRHGGIPEAVEHGRTGFLVAERDFEALAAAMKEIVRSPNTFREMGQLASEHVAAHFEQSAQIRNLESHYDEAAARAGAEARVPVPQRAPVPTPFPERVHAK